MLARHAKVLGLILVLGTCVRPPGGLGPAARAGDEEAQALESELARALELRAQQRQEEGLAVLEALRAKALASGHWGLATRALIRHGDLASDLLRPEQPARDYEAAYAEAEARHDWASMGRAAHDRAFLLDQSEGTEDSDTAIAWYTRAADARRRTDDRSGLRVSVNNLGLRHLRAKHAEEARQFLEEALALALALNSPAEVARTEAHLALLWALLAEGAFPAGPGIPPLPLDPVAEAEARRHFAAAAAATAAATEPAELLCVLLGVESLRCERLSADPAPAKTSITHFITLAQLLDAGPQLDTSALMRASAFYFLAADALALSDEVNLIDPGALERAGRDRLGRALAISPAACEASASASTLCDRARRPVHPRGQ